MDWQEILTQVILYVVGVAISIGVGFLSYFIRKKIKSEEGQKLAQEALQIVSDGVNYVQQTYVSNLKGTDMWDEEAMKNASNQALQYITTNMSQQIKDYLEKNGDDLTTWISNQIEIAVNKNKKA